MDNYYNTFTQNNELPIMEDFEFQAKPSNLVGVQQQETSFVLNNLLHKRKKLIHAFSTKREQNRGLE